MSIFLDTTQFLTIFFYFVGTLLFFTKVLTKDLQFSCLAKSLIAAGFFTHSLFVYSSLLVPSGGLAAPQGTLPALAAWVATLIAFFLCNKIRSVFLAMLITPLALVLFLSFSVGTPTIFPRLQILSDFCFLLYIGCIFFSLFILTLCSISSIFYLFIEKKIKTKSPLSDFTKELPSLYSFDRFNAFCTITVFPIFTLGILSAFIWNFITFHKIQFFSFSQISILFLWFLFSYIFYKRNFTIWNGKKPAQYTLFLFIISINIFLGIYFFNL